MVWHWWRRSWLWTAGSLAWWGKCVAVADLPGVDADASRYSGAVACIIVCRIHSQWWRVMLNHCYEFGLCRRATYARDVRSCMILSDIWACDIERSANPWSILRYHVIDMMTNWYGCIFITVRLRLVHKNSCASLYVNAHGNHKSL